MQINKQNVIVTGAASGLGLELTKQLLAEGANVAAVDINRDNLKKLEEDLDSKQLKTYIVDMGDVESIKKFREDYKKDYNDVDIIINNAGIIQPFVKVQDLDDKIINKTMNVNFFGPLHLIRLFFGDLTKDKKEQYIVNVSSMGGFFPFPGQTIYGASKAALKLFTEGLYAELENTNVRVMVVLPGAMATNITKNSNVETSTSEENSSFKLLSPVVGASEIIKGIKKNKFKVFLGSDSKFLRFLYKINSIWAIRFINKKMSKMN
ncbi:MAG: SDR family NAD(P)-dependent oxidoreductase [Bacilli bacterium]|nr:SDR family NAD(P)-dependent oxidoreductase [Bacilli bacterium]